MTAELKALVELLRSESLLDRCSGLTIDNGRVEVRLSVVSEPPRPEFPPSPPVETKEPVEPSRFELTRRELRAAFPNAVLPASLLPRDEDFAV